jgi:hypothetical protein
MHRGAVERSIWHYSRDVTWRTFTPRRIQEITFGDGFLDQAPIGTRSKRARYGNIGGKRPLSRLRGGLLGVNGPSSYFSRSSIFLKNHPFRQFLDPETASDVIFRRCFLVLGPPAAPDCPISSLCRCTQINFLSPSLELSCSASLLEYPSASRP